MMGDFCALGDRQLAGMHACDFQIDVLFYLPAFRIVKLRCICSLGYRAYVLLVRGRAQII